MKILIVCLGNICRSPLAEGILKHKAEEAGLSWQIDSAGTNGFHTGEPPHHLSQKVAIKNGIDISCQLSRKFIRADVKMYDRIYAMADDVMDEIRQIAGSDFVENKVGLFLDELADIRNKNVPDPWYGDEDGYHEVFELIERGSSAIIRNYLTPKQLSNT